MKCPKCGALVSENDNFCEDCGASLRNIKHVSRTIEDCKGAFKSDIFLIDSNLAAASNIGRRHPTNEDAAAVMRCEDGSSILIVADGVSSAVNAISASVQAITRAREVMANGAGGVNLIRDAINQANDVVVNLPYETRADGIYGPETTIIMAAVSGDTAFIGWVGDSRAYIIGKQSQEFLTVDDSWIELVVEAGQMTRSQAELDRRAHYVTQVLGMHDQTMEVHTIERKIEKGQMLLLCTDGLWNYFQGDNDLLDAVADFGMEKDASEICEHLIDMANIAGGHDNITAAILKNI